MKIDIVVSKRIDAERKKDADKSGISTKITGIAPSLFIVGSKISSYQLSETALNAMAIINMIGQIDESREVCYQPVRKTQLPQWCPEGLTRIQKRRMQRERQEELSREENSSESENR